MNQLVYFDISGLLIIVGVLLAFYSRRNVPCNKNKIYKVIIWVVFLSTLLDIILVSSRNYGIMLKEYYEYLTIIYYAIHTSIPCLFYLYCVSYLSNYRNMRIHRLIYLIIPQCLLIIVILTTHFTKWIVYADKNGFVKYGKFHFICYVIAGYYIFVMLGFLWRYRSQYKNRDVYLLTIYSCCSIIPIAIQCIFPNIILENFCAVGCCLVIMVTVASNECVVETNTMLFNESALHDTISSLLNTCTIFQIIIVKITEQDLIFERMGTQTVMALSRKVAAFLKSIADVQSVFYLNHDCFAIVVSRDVDAYISNIENRMKEPWCIDKMEFQISACCLPLSIPKNAKDLEGIYEYIKYMETITGISKGRLTLEDVNLQSRKRKIQVEDAIQYGLKNKTFQVFYQPIYSFEKNRIASAEALIRLIDPVIGFIPPDEFIPIAESNGAVIEIGEFVFDEVCKFIMENRLWEHGIDYVDINLSIIQCVQVDLVSRFKEIMDHYKVPSNMICLEITETAEEKTPEILKKNISRFQQLGIKLALDDYGTGYSNLYKVITLPISIVKFDKYMVWTALNNDKAKLALECEINAMKKMNMKIVAEGVEDRLQLAELHRMNSDFIQGYYFSKPIPGKDFNEFIRQAGDNILQYVESERVM